MLIGSSCLDLLFEFGFEETKVFVTSGVHIALPCLGCLIVLDGCCTILDHDLLPEFLDGCSCRES